MNIVSFDDALLERTGALRVALRRAIARLHDLEAQHGKGPWTVCPHERCQKAVALLADSVCERCQRSFVRGLHAAGKFCRDCWDIRSDRPATPGGDW